MVFIQLTVSKKNKNNSSFNAGLVTLQHVGECDVSVSFAVITTVLPPFLLYTIFILCFVCLCVCVHVNAQVFQVRGSSEGSPWDGLDAIFTQVPE